MKRKLALWMVFVLLLTLVCPAGTAKAASKKNPITEIGIANLPTDNTINVGDSFNFDPEVKATKTKGKTTGVVYFEVDAKTNTAGVSSSRWGVVYPVYAGSFEIRALAFASASDLTAWKNARKENKYQSSDELNSRFATAVSEWAKIYVESETPGYAVVRSQAQLNKALKNSKCTDIHIITEKERTFTIPAKNYRKKTLTVNAPLAEITNSGRFAQIEIAQIKTSTFIERAVGNQIRVTAPVARIVVDGGTIGNLDLAPVPNLSHPEPKIDVLGLGGTIRQFNVSAPGAVAIDANEKSGLKVGSITVNASSNLSIATNVASNVNETAALPITIGDQAGESKIETSTRLEVNAHASIEVVVNKESSEAAATIVNLLKAVTAMIGGTATDTIVNVLKEAAGATVESSTTVEINASADVKISLTESAKESVVKREEGVKVEASKDSTDVVVVNPDGSSETVESGTENIATPTPEPVPTTSTSGGGSYIPPVQTPTPLPYVDHEMDWKDATLEAAMREKTGIADRAIRLSDVYDMEEFEFIGTEEATIKNVDALGELVNLKKLFFDGNEISDISALKNLTKLEEFSIIFSPLESIEVVSAWKNLKSLSLMGCGIKDISVLKDMTGLTGLWLTLNEISDVTPLAGLTNLTQLYLGMNQITDISALKGLTNLETLTLNMNVGLTDISIVSGLKKLQIFTIYGLEGITDLTPLAGLTEMKELYLGNAPISDLTPLAGMTKMDYLVIEDGPIVTDLTPLANMTELTGLYLRGNPITNIDALAKMTKLEYLSLDETYVGNIDVLKNMTGMKELSVSNYDGEADFARITDISALSGMTQLEYLYLGGQQIQNENLDMLKGAVNLKELDLGGIDDEGKISDIKALEGKDLENLNLNGHRVGDISVLKGMVHLKELHLGNGRYSNGISDLSVLTGMTALEGLNLSGNPISDITVLGTLPNLHRLYLSAINGDGQITDIKALEGKDIKELHLDGHLVSDLSPLSGAGNLTELRVSRGNGAGASITSIEALNGKTKLEILCLDGQQVSDIRPLANSKSLRELGLDNWGNDPSAAKIKDISALTGMTELENLRLREHEISDITALQGMTKLISLDLTNNPVSNITPLAGAISLQMLYLDGTQVGNIDALKNMSNLRELRISNWDWDTEFTRISDISVLAGKKFLEVLDLGGHMVENIEPLKDAESLTELRIGGSNGLEILPVLNISVLSGKNLSILYMNDYEIRDTSPLAGMGSLTELGICVNEVVTGSAVTTTFDKVVAGLGQLWHLDISRTAFNDLEAVLTGLQQIDSLSDFALRSVENITDQTLNALCQFEHLTTLDLGYNNFYNVNLSLLKGLKNKDIQLWLDECWINDEAIPEETLTDLRSSIPNVNPPRE